MKKTYKLEELECANCAAKIEENVRKIDGVSNATVNFMSQKMVIEASETEIGRIIEQTKKVIKKFEPDVRVVEL